MRAESKESLRLLINAEGKRVDAGILRSDDWLVSETVEGNPVETIASVLRTILDRSGISPGEIHQWIYSGGPGSLLGLRSLAMLLSTWEVSMLPQSVTKFRFSGLVWAAREIQRIHPDTPFTLISPWRTNTWNVLSIDSKTADENSLRVVEGNPAPNDNGALYVLGERLRMAPPANAIPISLPAFRTLAYHLESPGFLVQTEEVEPLLSGTTQYKKWSPTPISL